MKSSSGRGESNALSTSVDGPLSVPVQEVSLLSASKTGSMSPTKESPSKEGGPDKEQNDNLIVEDEVNGDSIREMDVDGGAGEVNAAEERLEPEYYAELREACRQANLAQIRQILSQNPSVDLNIHDSELGYTSLLEVICEGIVSEGSHGA